MKNFKGLSFFGGATSPILNNLFIKIVALVPLLFFVFQSVVMGQCSIDLIEIGNYNCMHMGTNDPSDDALTVSITVYYSNPPSTGFLVLEGDFSASVHVDDIIVPSDCQMAGLTCKKFWNLPVDLDGTDKNVTAYFTDSPCTLSVNPILSSIHTQNCIRCNPEVSPRPIPECWPDETMPCGIRANYAPDPVHLEQTPLRYIQAIVHVFQKEDPANPGQVHPTDPGNWQDIPAHKAIIDSWFNDPTDGINAFLANLCEDATVTSPYISDSRLRMLFDVDNDLFFHADNEAWGIGWYAPAPCNDPKGAGFNNAVTTYVTSQTDPDIKNAFHIFVTMGSWVDYDSGNPLAIAGVPDPFDCYNPCTGGLTGDMFSCSDSPTIANFGSYQQYQQANNQVPIICGDPFNGNPALLGRGFVGELMHVLSVDHNGGNFHIQNNNFGDDCDDTPDISDENLMDCTGGKCNLTECQLGRAHHYLANLNPGFLRFPDGMGGFTSEGNCALTDPDIIIKNEEDIVWNGLRSLRSNIIVQSGGRLTINCDLGMPENARITVESGGQLIVDGARIYNNCDGDFWEGIIVQGTPGLPQAWDYVNQQYYAGQCTIRSGSIIEQANIGVRTGELFTQNRNGGVVRASDTEFLNCRHYGIYFPTFQNHTLSGLPTGNLSYFARCDFIVDNTISNQFTAMAYLKGVDGITFWGCNFLNQLPHNEAFAGDRKKGIQAINAGFRVFGICTDNPQTPNCQNFANSRFEGFAYGIHTGNYQLAHTFQVSRADFDDNLVGIYANGAPNADITRCNFNVGSQLPVNTQYNPENANRGIHLHGCTGYRVEGNALTGATALAGTTSPVGILVGSSGEEPNEVYRNTLDNLQIGNLSNGLNRNPAPISYEGLQYLCNTNGASNVNILDFAVPAEKGGIKGIAGRQGSAALAAGNTFSLPPSNLETHFLNKEEPFTYFRPSGVSLPSNYSTLTITLDDGLENNCPSTLPGGEKEFADGTEKNQTEQLFYGSTDNAEKTKAANRLVRYFLVDSTAQDLDSARFWLANKNTLYSHFTIVETYLQEGDATGAQLALDNIPTQFTLSGEPQLEYNHFNTLKSLQIAAEQNGTTDEQLVAANQATLTQVADAGDYYASKQAKLLLNEVNGETYLPHVELPDAGQQELLAPPHNSSVVSVGTEQVVAIPNPAKEMTTFHYSLGKESPAAMLVVKSVDGRTVWQSNLEHQAGHVNWHFGTVAGGIYFFSLKVDGKTILTDRLVIVR
ncbi:MAG TPA: hypothetical protein ENJ95_01340 [Bacteroidetes bacterium]|nr:hypothetical protein [Bacteroidota bacterium]